MYANKFHQFHGMAAQLPKTGENGRIAWNIDRMDLRLVLLRSQRRAGDFLYENFFWRLKSRDLGSSPTKRPKLSFHWNFGVFAPHPRDLVYWIRLVISDSDMYNMHVCGEITRFQKLTQNIVQNLDLWQNYVIFSQTSPQIGVKLVRLKLSDNFVSK
jgi:hypothetical protein